MHVCACVHERERENERERREKVEEAQCREKVATDLQVSKSRQENISTLPDQREKILSPHLLQDGLQQHHPHMIPHPRVEDTEWLWR